MLRRLLPGLLLAVPTVVQAQAGTIAFQHSVRVEIPEELRSRMDFRGGGGDFPTERTSEVVLLFNEGESLMRPVPGSESGGLRREQARPAEAMDGRRTAMLSRMRMRSSARSDRETLTQAYSRFEEGTLVEARDFLGRTFLIHDRRPEYAWRVTGEQAEYLGYLVQKATAVQDSTRIEAWFTPQIPVPGGPGTYGGLPGMILVVSVDEGRSQYTATAISLAVIAEGVIVPPSDGEEVSREEYERIVEEKLEELRTVGGGPVP